MNRKKVPGLRLVQRSRPSPRPGLLPVARRSAWLYSGPNQLNLELALPAPAGRCAGWIILPLAGGQTAIHSTLLPALHRAGFATLIVELLTAGEARDGAAAFNTAALSARLMAVTRWLSIQPEARGQRLGYLAAGTAAGAAFGAAAQLAAGGLVAAIVSLNGRADLAAAQLGTVMAPSLLVVGRRDRLVLEANRAAARRLNPTSRLVVAPSFRYLRYALREPGRLDAILAVEWLARHVAGVVPPAESRRPSLISLLDAWPAHGRAAAAATVLALLAALGAPSQTALAATSTITIDGSGNLTYAGSSASSSLTVTQPTANVDTYTFYDPIEGTINHPAGCVTLAGLSYYVQCASISSLTLNMNDGDDTVTLLPRDGFAPTTVNGGNHTFGDSLVIDDSNTTGFDDPVALTGSTFDRTAISTIHYGGFEAIQVKAEPTNNAITVSGTSGATTIQGQDGNDTIDVGNGLLDGIDGMLNVFGGTGTDLVVIDDSLTGSNELLKSGSAPRAGVAAITFNGGDIEALQMKAGSGADNLDASNPRLLQLRHIRCDLSHRARHHWPRRSNSL